MTQPLPDATMAAIKDALARKQKIEAIKLYREATGSGLTEAKQAVEALESGSAANVAASTPKGEKGCLGLLMVVAVLVLALLQFF